MSGYIGYNMPSTTTVTSGGVLEGEQPGGLGVAEEDEAFFNADVKWRGVAKPMRLGRVTVMCMIFNRMIGKYCLLVSTWIMLIEDRYRNF
jgi:hypothetical protein